MLVGAGLTAVPVVGAGPALAVGGCAGTAKTVVRGVPWAQQTLAAERAWVLTRGARVVVGVVDTGVSAAAPALAGAVLPGRDVSKGGGRADDDCSGHGTFVAGLLAARPVDGRGFAGVAPAVRILPVRVTADENDVTVGPIAAGIRTAVDSGASVVTVAFGMSSAPRALRSAVAYARARDVLVVATTDSSDLVSGGQVYPAALPGVLAVGSIGSDGKPNSTQTNTRPALVAPGEDLVSVAPHGGGNVTASGSGVDVAFVAGAAALVRDYRPRLTADQVRHRLVTTADHPSGRLPDPAFGYGTVDPVAAVTTVLPEESGETPLPAGVQRLHVVLPRPVDRRPEHVAFATSAAVMGCAALGGLTIFLVRLGRRRDWRPGAPHETGGETGD